ncbi:AAA family ATPase [Geminicoccaceae bacterium 1502E]|nr:AAA family ATPase [Geminicoccaceae bacterium 1502E]
MIILIGGEKGGTGKTTLSIHLAALRTAAGKEVLLVDTDRQGSASSWCAVRDEEGRAPRVACVQKFGKTLGADIRAMAAKYDDIIIDAGGRDSVELRAGMTVSDLLYIPIQASQFDVWTLDQMNTLVEQASAINERLRAFAVLNRASSNPSVKEADDARAALAEYENLAIAQSVIRDRIAFRKAAREGATVGEITDRDAKAIAEINRLYGEIFGG